MAEMFVTYTHTHTCVCVCVCMSSHQNTNWTERQRKLHDVVCTFTLVKTRLKCLKVGQEGFHVTPTANTQPTNSNAYAHENCQICQQQMPVDIYTKHISGVPRATRSDGRSRLYS